MAVRASSIDWKGMGGRVPFGIPDRVKVTCPRCGKEVSQQGAQLRLDVLDDRLILKVVCPGCDSVNTPKVEWEKN